MLLEMYTNFNRKKKISIDLKGEIKRAWQMGLLRQRETKGSAMTMTTGTLWSSERYELCQAEQKQTKWCLLQIQLFVKKWPLHNPKKVPRHFSDSSSVSISVRLSTILLSIKAISLAWLYKPCHATLAAILILDYWTFSASQGCPPISNS